MSVHFDGCSTAYSTSKRTRIHPAHATLQWPRCPSTSLSRPSSFCSLWCSSCWRAACITCTATRCFAGSVGWWVAGGGGWHHRIRCSRRHKAAGATSLLQPHTVPVVAQPLPHPRPPLACRRPAGLASSSPPSPFTPAPPTSSTSATRRWVHVHCRLCGYRPSALRLRHWHVVENSLPSPCQVPLHPTCRPCCRWAWWTGRPACCPASSAWPAGSRCWGLCT